MEHKPRALAEEQAADYDAALLNDDAAWILAHNCSKVSFCKSLVVPCLSAVRV